MTTEVKIYGASDDLLEVEVTYEDGSTAETEFNIPNQQGLVVIFGVGGLESEVVEVSVQMTILGDWVATAVDIAGVVSHTGLVIDRPDYDGGDTGISLEFESPEVKVRYVDQLNYLPERLR